MTVLAVKNYRFLCTILNSGSVAGNTTRACPVEFTFSWGEINTESGKYAINALVKNKAAEGLGEQAGCPLLSESLGQDSAWP